MNDSKIGVRYAKALFQTAAENKLTEDVMADIRLLDENLKNNDFREVLESPVVKISQKKDLIKTVFRPVINDLTYRFIILVLENKRESYLESILRNYSKTFRDHKGVKRAEIVISSEINEDTRKQFVGILEKTFGSDIELEEVVDADIIGGFILKVEDEQYDASVLSALAKMRKQLKKTSIEK
jgi:F-type H+-transporting ATPase subunit delta